MVDQTIVKIFTAKMSVTSCVLYLKDAILNCEDGDVKYTTTKIENEHISFASFLLLVKAISNGSSSGPLMILRTFIPLIMRASLVAWRWASLK